MSLFSDKARATYEALRYDSPESLRSLKKRKAQKTPRKKNKKISVAAKRSHNSQSHPCLCSVCVVAKTVITMMHDYMAVNCKGKSKA
jgi:hypothetical protein